MVALSASGENKVLRYKQQDVDVAYIAGQKVYGRNLWRLTGIGANDYGTSNADVLDNFAFAQHVKFTVTGIASNMWSRLIQNLYPNGTATSYELNKDYTTSFWVRPSLSKIRLYLYLGALGGVGTNYGGILINLIPNEWNKITYTRKPAGQDAFTSNRSLIGMRYLQSDHVGVNLIGQTLEIKEVKTEEGELSPYSIHSSLL